MYLRKKLRVVGIIMLITLLFSSCGSNNDVEELPFIPLETTDNAIFSEYRVFISDTASSGLADKANELCQRIEAQTGVKTVLFRDNDYVKKEDNVWNIYVGNVKFSESRQKLSDMRSDDHTCRSTSNATIIGGKSDKATLSAIERFMSDILPVSDSKRLIPDGGGFDCIGNYATERIYIGELPISNFKIAVYDADDVATVACAYKLRDKISNSFGYWLDISLGSPQIEGYGIYLEGNSRECKNGRAELSFLGKDVVLKASDEKGLEILLDKFVQLLIADGTEGVLNPYIPQSLYVPYYDSECKIASMCPYSIFPLDTVNKINTVKNTVDKYSPDMLFCGALDCTDRQNLNETLSSYDQYATDGGGTFGVSSVIAQRLLSDSREGILVELFYVDKNGFEFIYVNVSGSTQTAMDIDISELMVDADVTPFPVVAVVHTYNSAQVTLSQGDVTYFGEVINNDMLIYGDNYSYTCYADMSRLSVSASGENSTCGYKQITISTP